MFPNSNGSMSLHNLLSSHLSHNFVGNEDDLQQLSSDLLSLSMTGLPQQPYYNCSVVDDIAHGKNLVSVPPGIINGHLAINFSFLYYLLAVCNGVLFSA